MKKYFFAYIVMIYQNIVHQIKQTHPIDISVNMSYLIVYFEEIDMTTGEGIGKFTPTSVITKLQYTLLYNTILDMIRREDYSILNENILKLGTKSNFVFTGSLCKSCGQLIPISGYLDTSFCLQCNSTNNTMLERIVNQNTDELKTGIYKPVESGSVAIVDDITPWKKVNDFDLSCRLINTLQSHNILIIDDLIKIGRDEIVKWKDISKMSIQEIDELMKSVNLKY